MWWHCIIWWNKDWSFEEHFDSIWLSPAVSHSLLCRGPRRDVCLTFWTLQTFHFSKTEGLHPVHSREDSMHPSISLWATLISILHPKDKPLMSLQNRTRLRWQSKGSRNQINFPVYRTLDECTQSLHDHNKLGTPTSKSLFCVFPHTLASSIVFQSRQIGI